MSDMDYRYRRAPSSAGGEDLIVALHHPSELFSVKPEAMLERERATRAWGRRDRQRVARPVEGAAAGPHRP
jgi:hypothetical protein